MSKYKGLFTFDVDNHRYTPVKQVDGIIDFMNYSPEPEEEPKGIQDIYVPPLSPTECVIDFTTEQEAKKAVEKLKAWKRLKDKGFRFRGWTIDDGLRISICSNIDEEDIYDEDKRKMKPDLNLLFGGEE